MAFRKQPYAFLLLLVFSTLLFFMINSSEAVDCVGPGSISVYWGQHSDDATEGSLLAACKTGNYQIVILEYLIVFDDGSTPNLDLANHCNPSDPDSAHPCSDLENQIKYCQDHGIKVFLSIGQDRLRPSTNRDSTLASSSTEDTSVAKKLAEYLLENFFSKKAGPLGKVSLDGIDIEDVTGTVHLQWDELVKEIKKFTTPKIYLSAAPQCVYPDRNLDKAIQTGLFDYIWVEFFYYNPSCIYSAGKAAKGADDLLKAWDTWTSKVPNSKIFLGLTASPDIAGYIDPDVLKSDVLPTAKKASNYGGVMIWDRYRDINNKDYSGQIKDSVPKSCKCVCDDKPASTNFYGLQQARPFPM